MDFNLRELIVQSLLTNSDIALLVDDRVYQAGAVGNEPGRADSTYVEKLPYISIRMSLLSEAAELGGTDFATLPKRRNFQVWVHDSIGDYSRIDTILELAEKVLTHLPNRGDFFCNHFIEVSQDQVDDILNHAVRFARFQAVTKG